MVAWVVVWVPSGRALDRRDPWGWQIAARGAKGIKREKRLLITPDGGKKRGIDHRPYRR